MGMGHFILLLQRCRGIVHIDQSDPFTAPNGLCQLVLLDDAGLYALINYVFIESTGSIERNGLHRRTQDETQQ